MPLLGPDGLPVWNENVPEQLHIVCARDLGAIQVHTQSGEVVQIEMFFLLRLVGEWLNVQSGARMELHERMKKGKILPAPFGPGRIN